MEFGYIEDYKDDSVTARQSREQAIQEIINGGEPLDLPSDEIMYFHKMSKLNKYRLKHRAQQIANMNKSKPALDVHRTGFANFQFGRNSFSR